MKFPSTEWFRKLQQHSLEELERFKRLGFCDCTVGIKVEPEGGQGEAQGFVLIFDGYTCSDVRESARPEEESDFTLIGSYDVWQDMIQNIRENGEADLRHTLNYLALPGIALRVVAQDQLKEDLFYRYNQTLQQFFNQAAKLETEFVAPVRG
jgi:hypothetical protein